MGEDSSDDESESELEQGGQSGAHQEVPVAVRKLYDSFTGAPQPITQNCTRSGRDAASPQPPMRAVDVNHLSPEPTTLREAQASPEWPNGQRACKREMYGQLARQASIRMVLDIAGVKDWELRQLDVDMAYLEANVKEELYIELPEDYRNSCGQRREEQHHAGSSGRKNPDHGRCPTDRGGEKKMRVTLYREAVGILMWAATMTRPDVTYVARQLGKFNDNPGPAHWRAAKRALQYLWRTKDVGITYGGRPGLCTKLLAWVDADFATCPDTRRSVSGRAVMLGGAQSVGS